MAMLEHLDVLWIGSSFSDCITTPRGGCPGVLKILNLSLVSPLIYFYGVFRPVLPVYRANPGEICLHSLNADTYLLCNLLWRHSGIAEIQYNLVRVIYQYATT